MKKQEVIKKLQKIEPLQNLVVLLKRHKFDEVAFYKKTSTDEGNQRFYKKLKASFPEEEWSGDDGSFCAKYFDGAEEYCFCQDSMFSLANIAFRHISKEFFGFFGIYTEHQKIFDRHGNLDHETIYRRAIVVLPVDFTGEIQEGLEQQSIEITNY